jgi:hypothetical protein
MISVGLDFSKNSPGVCVRNDDDITFISFIRGIRTPKKTAIHYGNLQNVGVEIYQHTRIPTPKEEYQASELWKIEDAIILADLIASKLPDHIDIIGMEGFSYGSKGNAGLDIAGYSYCVRRALFKKYGDKIRIFSPSSAKMNAGKGNAGKEEMLEFFLNTDDDALKQNGMWKGITDSSIAIEKPVDDLVDSYFIQDCARKSFYDPDVFKKKPKVKKSKKK